MWTNVTNPVIRHKLKNSSTFLWPSVSCKNVISPYVRWKQIGLSSTFHFWHNHITVSHNLLHPLEMSSWKDTGLSSHIDNTLFTDPDINLHRRSHIQNYVNMCVDIDWSWGWGFLALKSQFIFSPNAVFRTQCI